MLFLAQEIEVHSSHECANMIKLAPVAPAVVMSNVSPLSLLHQAQLKAQKLWFVWMDAENSLLNERHVSLQLIHKQHPVCLHKILLQYTIIIGAGSSWYFFPTHLKLVIRLFFITFSLLRVLLS